MILGCAPLPAVPEPDDAEPAEEEGQDGEVVLHTHHQEAGTCCCCLPMFH